MKLFILVFTMMFIARHGFAAPLQIHTDQQQQKIVRNS